MIEITSTKLNPMTIPHLHVWGWEIPVYLFLGGLSAGLLVISSLMLLTDKDAVNSKTVRLATILSPVLLSIGMICLLLDLAYKFHVWRFYTRFVPSSPMSWGAWVLIIFMPFSIIQAIILYKKEFKSLPFIPMIVDFTEKHLRKIAIVNVFMGVLVGIYTGILLSSLFARPLWASSVLGIVFLMSGLSAGAALMLLLAGKEEKTRYSRLDMFLIMGEAVVICLFIIGSLMGTIGVREAMLFLIAGPVAPWFWIITILAGIVVPLFLEALEVSGKIRYTVIVPVLVLIGSMSLRYILVYAGQMIPTIS